MKILLIVLSIILILVLLFFVATPTGRSVWNNWWHDVEKDGDNSSYKNRKQVEDTCRALIASYTSDKLTYEQYKDSDNEEKQSWAEQAKMRANKTATFYNEFILKNSYIWGENIPIDIENHLPLIN